MSNLLKTLLQSLLLASIIAILINNPYVYNATFYNKSHFLYSLIITFASALACLSYVIYSRRAYQISGIDVVLMLILVWIGISRLLTCGMQAYLSESIFGVIAMANLYLVSRFVLTVRSFLYGLSAVFCIQVILICLQLHNSNGSVSIALLLTGTLDNSGLLSGFIVVLSPCALFLLRRWMPIYTYGLIAVIVFFLVLTQSRAALLAFIPVIYFCRKAVCDKLYHKLPKWVWIILISLIGTVLTLLKKHSALGRLSIWKVTLKNSFESMITGIGFGRFPKQYQDWQIDYFKNDSTNLTGFNSTDLPNNCFNEPLQIFTETGLIGLTLWGILAFLIFKSIFRLPRLYGFLFAPILIGFLIFSLFSYPLHSLPLLTIFICTLALLSKSSSKLKFTVSSLRARLIFIALFFSNLGFLYLIYQKNIAISDWNSLKSNQPKGKSASAYRAAYPYLRENAMFLLNYGRVLYREKEYQSCIRILRESEEISPQVEVFLLEGQALQKIKNFASAKALYIRTIYSFPLLIRPKYDLLKLYVLQGDIVKAYDLSQHIINSEVKVHSFETSRLLHDTILIYRSLSENKKINVK